MRSNDVLVAAAGTAAWGVALVVLLIVGPPSGDRWWLWVCVAGIMIGLFGTWYTPRLQAGRERLETERAAGRAAESGGAENGADHATDHTGEDAPESTARAPEPGARPASGPAADGR